MLNYLTQINRFYDFLETNRLSDSSINLWHALMHLNNKCGWRPEFSVAISTLEQKTSLSRSSVLRARNALQQACRISYRSRAGQQSALYSIIAFHSEPQTVTQNGIVIQHEMHSEPQTVTQSVPINKLEESKKNNNKISPIGFGEAAASPDGSLLYSSIEKNKAGYL